MNVIRLGLIGLGSIAEIHLEAIRETEGLRLAAVSSRNAARAEEIGIREGCEWSIDYKELLANKHIDMIILASSSGSHASIGLEVLEAGKHLLVEKPIAMTSAEGLQLINAAEKRGLVLSVFSQRRFEPQNIAIRRVLKEGKLGRLLMMEASCLYYRSQDYYDSKPWRGTISEDGGVLMNQAIHSIDLLLWLVGEPVLSVYGKTATQMHIMEAADMGQAVISFGNGAFGHILASTSIMPGFPPKLAFYGEKGSIVMEGTEITHWSVPDVDLPAGNGISGKGNGVSDPRDIPSTFHKLQLQDVAEALRTGKNPLVSGIEGMKAVRLIEGIYQSSRKGSEVVFNSW
jgi:UDP-N-acetyl-2-amino-2-deoxyglucuronate dehydrogenase